MMASHTLKGLWERRVPQILALYLGISWGVIQFIDWMVDRYLLSPYLIDVSLVLLISLVPSVLLIAYFHGRPGRDEWARTEKLGVPVNLVVSAALLFFVFGGKDLGAVTTTVALEDEEGNAIERVIPKSEFRKKFALFYFDNVSGDSTLDWLQYGIPVGVMADLYQDPFIDLKESASFRGQMREAGYEDGLGLPMALMRTITKDAHLDRFVTGTIAADDGALSVGIALHSTRGGAAISERTFSSRDVFELIDSISVGLKRDLEVPARHIEQAEDLPVQEIQTTSLSAFRSAVEGYTALVLDNDWQSAVRHFQNAVAEDPTYASAQHTLFQVYLYLNRAQDGIGPIQAAMEHIYRLPEREQFEVKSDYYFTRQDYEKAYAVLAMRVELYPDDIEGRTVLAQILLYQDKKDEAIAQYVKILEIDPEQYDYLRQIGSVYESQGEFEKALEYYEAYAEQFPDDHESFTSIGDLNRNIGNHEQAKEYLEKALLLEPNDVGVLVSLAALARDVGDFDRALDHYEEARAMAKTPQDLTVVYEGFRAYHESRGQLERAIEYAKLAEAERETFAPAMLLLMTRLGTLDTYVKAGHPDGAYEILEAVRAELAPPWDSFLPMGELNIYLALEEPDSAERALEGVESIVQTFSFSMLQPGIFRARGRIHEMRGEYDDAIASYMQGLELEPTNESIYERLGRCHREAGDLQEAEEYLLQALKVSPFSPTGNLEIARVYADMGDQRKALEHLEIALEVWSDADAAFKPAQEARRELAEVSPS